MKMKKMNITKKMYESGALAIVRAKTIERACEIADGCIQGQVPVMEMSYTLNNAGRYSRCMARPDIILAFCFSSDK